MPFQKGQSGNPNGRPTKTLEEKEHEALFKSLIKAATIPALENIIDIAKDRRHKDRLSACKYILEKAYGSSAVLATNDEPITINIVRHVPNTDMLQDDDDWGD